MDWLKSKTTLVAGGCLALLGLQSYGMMSMRSTVDDRVGSVERALQSMQNQDSAKIAQLTSDLDVVTKRMGVTTQELDEAHAVAQQLKQENNQNTQRLRREIASKADSKSVTQFREEANSRLDTVQQDTDTKFAGVTGDVKGVRTDLDATRDDLTKSRNELGTLIAHNSTELAELRRRGDRDYVEFDLHKNKGFDHIGDVLVQLKKTDVKKQKFDVMINADDSSILKKDRTANEPITFLVGRDHVRYEFVVNSVDKDRIRGYLATPKDKILAAEAPPARRLQ
jgi:chromosome segregation ATPase